MSSKPPMDIKLVHAATSNRMRSEILKKLMENDLDYGRLKEFFNLSDQMLEYHLKILERALSDPLRLQILRALQVSELCVCILVALTNYNYSALSHHLKLLKDAGLIDVRRDGNFLIYSLTRSGRELLARLL